MSNNTPKDTEEDTDKPMTTKDLRVIMKEVMKEQTNSMKTIVKASAELLKIEME